MKKVEFQFVNGRKRRISERFAHILEDHNRGEIVKQKPGPKPKQEVIENTKEEKKVSKRSTK